MTSTVSLLVAILVSLQYTLVACSQDSNSLDNNIQPNAPMPRRRPRTMVHIREAPPANVQLQLGTSLVLKCEVIGKPAPTVQWMKNGEPIIDYAEETNDILPSHPSSAAKLISMIVVTSAVTGDVFTCVATNGVKRDTASTTVYVVEGNDEENLLTLHNLFKAPSTPLITSYYTDVLQNVGTDIVLPCRVQNPSNTQIYWQDNLENIIFDDIRKQVLRSGDLLLTSLRWSDMGNFTCIAKNMYGKEAAATFLYPIKV